MRGNPSVGLSPFRAGREDSNFRKEEAVRAILATRRKSPGAPKKSAAARISAG